MKRQNAFVVLLIGAILLVLHSLASKVLNKDVADISEHPFQYNDRQGVIERSARPVQPSVDDSPSEPTTTAPTSRNTTITHIALLGERGSGTTWACRLLQQSFEAASNGRVQVHSTCKSYTPIGWKHGFIDEQLMNDGVPGYPHPDNVLVVVLYRNPFAWIASMSRNPHEIRDFRNRTRLLRDRAVEVTAWYLQPDMETLLWEYERQKQRFLSTSACVGAPDSTQQPNSHLSSCLTPKLYTCPPRQRPEPRHPGKGRLVSSEQTWRKPCTDDEWPENLMQLRSLKVLNWESLRAKLPNVYYARYEDLLVNPGRVLAHLAKSYSLEYRIPIEEATSGQKRQEVLQQTYMKTFTQQELSLIRQKLDHRLERHLGYDIETGATILQYI